MVNTTNGPRAQGEHRGTVRIVAWPDEVIDNLGVDPRSAYVEKFWLSALGPSTTWLLRHIATELDARPGGFELDLTETAQRLGLGHKGGRNSPFSRALGRLAHFDLARPHGVDVLDVRRKVPPLNLRQVRHLTPALQAEHQRWQQDQLALSPAHQHQRRANRLALSLLELGEDREATVRQLVEWQYEPHTAERATSWASDRHRLALDAVAPSVDRGQEASERSPLAGPELNRPTSGREIQGVGPSAASKTPSPPPWWTPTMSVPLTGPTDSLSPEL